MRYAVLAVVVLGGCGASMVRTPNAAPMAYAPVNESRAGEVRYSLNGWAAVVQSRREDAYKQMHASCHGAYRIDSEQGITTGQSVETDGNGSASVTPRMVQVIRFSCVPLAYR